LDALETENRALRADWQIMLRIAMLLKLLEWPGFYCAEEGR